MAKRDNCEKTEGLITRWAAKEAGKNIKRKETNIIIAYCK